ncbi:MAG: efflux RND transporter periplasmic adaptor subunit [Cytophagales bacterium]|nr:efflux RND transporter periplasmic adaptor subunit [Cytophagales bacterium]
MKISFTVISLLVVLQACRAPQPEETSSPRTQIPVQVITATSYLLQPEIKAAGQFTTDDETLLSFKVGGVIDKIFVKEGDAIRAGQLLATLHLTEINAQVTQAELAFEKATRDFNRAQNLYKDSVATLEQFQNARTAWEVASQQLQSARFNRSYSEIRAIRSGNVLRKFVQEGQVITSGSPVLQTNGAGSQHWILKVGVADREWAIIEPGDKATITADALPGKIWKGVVSKKSAAVDAYNGALQVEITVVEQEQQLAAGLVGTATLRAARNQQVWKLPYEALLDGNANAGYVFIAQDGKAVKTPVAVIGIEKNSVLISGGLADGQQVIVSGSAYLKDGSELTIISR